MECPFCGGEGEDLGTLGRNNYQRCRQCGADFVDESEKESYNEERDIDSDELIEWN